MSILTSVCRSLRFSFAQHYSLAAWGFFVFLSFLLLHWLPAFFLWLPLQTGNKTLRCNNKYLYRIILITLIEGAL